MGLNDGGVKRGDREDTGDLEAQHKDGVSRQGSGVRAGDEGPAGAATANPSAFGGGRIVGSTGKTENPSYALVEHGDAEGYIEEDADKKREQQDNTTSRK
jgi:hypothetical protein